MRDPHSFISRHLVLLCVAIASAKSYGGDILGRLPAPDQACHVRFGYLRDAEVRENPDGTKTYRIKGASACSATIIGPRKLIFAAHCVPSPERGPYVAEVFCREGKIVRRVLEQPVVNPKYNQYTHFHDAALMTVDTTLGIEPAKIPRSKQEFYEILQRNECVLYGYGEDSLKPDSKPRTIRAFLMSTEQARTVDGLGDIPSDDSKLFVVADGQIMHGDSGGGLLCKNRSGEWVAMSVFSNVRSAELKPGAGETRAAWSDHQEVKASTLQVSGLTNIYPLNEWIDAYLDGRRKSPVPPPSERPRSGPETHGPETRRNDEPSPAESLLRKRVWAKPKRRTN